MTRMTGMTGITSMTRVTGMIGITRMIVRSLSAKYRPDRYRRDKSVKFGTELP